MNPFPPSPAFRITALASLLACFPNPFLVAQTSEPESPAGGVLLAVQALMNDNRRDEALAKLQAAIRQPGVEPDHPATATLHIAQARILRDLGRHGEAATHAATAASINEKAMGADNLFAMHARWTAATEAMSAKQPADAATHAAALLDTFSAYVNSGAAERAQWASVPQAAPLLKEMPSFDEAGVTAISSLLGRAWAAAGETDKALPLLRAAAASLERLHGRGYPELVDLTEALERIAAKRGETLGQRYVGSLGFFSKLVFEGNTLISADALRSGLTCDVETVYASHPAADLADFLPVLAGRLARGYLDSGFPEAKVEALLERREDGSRILVRIHEGPRYLKGRILVEGATTIPADQLRKMLLPKEDTPKGPSLIAQVREIMTKSEKLLPQPDSKADKEMLEGVMQQESTFNWNLLGGKQAAEHNGDGAGAGLETLFKSLSSSTSSDPDWTPGKPVKFSQDIAEPLSYSVRRCLAELGHPLVRFHTRYGLNADGTADLIIRIGEEGPLAIIGRIQVVGAKAHRPEEIIAAAGLTGGRPFTPEALDRAMLALWETGRFFPFAITPVPRGADTPEVDLFIQAREIVGVPRLDAKLPPECEVVRRFIHNFNDWMSSGGSDDLLVTTDAGDGIVLTVGFSASDGMILDATWPDGVIRATASVAKDCIRIRLQRENRDSVIRLPLPMDRFKSTIQLLPDPETGKATFGLLFGFSSQTKTTGLPTTVVTLSPALPLIKPEAFRRGDDGFIEYVENDRVMLRLDPTTAMPVSTDNTRIEFRKGAVKELQQSIAAELDRPGAGGGLADWVEAARTLARLADENGEFEGLLAQLEIQRWLDFARALAKPEVTKPFADLWTKWSATKDRETFMIPLDAASLQRAGAMNLLVSFGAVGLAELLAPPDSWVAKLAREVVFIQGGNTRYTARTMKELLDDPTMGPYGCLLAARVMARYDAQSAVRFLHKARTQANAAAFRHDWRLVLDSPTGIGQAVADTLAALGSIPPQQEAELTAPLDPAQAAWLRDFLGSIRTKPAAANLSAWLAPHMDKLWDRLLRENFLTTIEDTLNPPIDPTLIAATVDGMPVSRAWMKKLEDGGFYRVLLPPLAPDPARPWTQRPLLAETIRLLLWKKSWAAAATTALPANAAASGSDLTPEDFQRIVQEATTLLSQIPEPADGELARWWRQHGPVLGRQCHLHTIRSTADDEQPDTLNRSTGLVRAAAAHLRDGLPIATLAAAAAKDKTCVLTASCDQDTLLVDMRPEFSQSLEDLKPGEMSSVVGLKTLRWAAILVGWNDTPPPPLDEARDSILTAWQSDRIQGLLQQKLAPLERAADIRVLEDPAPPAAPESVFQLILKDSPDSPVARLGVFWEQVLAKDPKAGNALGQLLATRALDPSALTQLDKALRSRGLTELADRAKAAAAR